MRKIVEDDDFNEQVRQLGGHARVDPALDTILDGLMRNPEGFYKFEGEDYSFRYAKTVAFGDLPAFLVIFILDIDGNVYLKQIEEDVPF